MLSDRDYMNRGGRSQGPAADPADGVKCVFILIAINVLTFLFTHNNFAALDELAMSSTGMKNLKIWQLFTAMFMHGGWMHLLFNMWGLYLFGTISAPVLGARRFLILYFIGGLSGNLLWLLLNWNSPAYVLGASGALFGILIGTAMLFPNKEFIMLLFPVPMKLKTMAVVFVILEVFMEFSAQNNMPLPTSQRNVAHLAHLGGLLGGYIYISIAMRGLISWDPLGFIHSSQTGNRFKGWKVHSPPPRADSMDSRIHESDSNASISQKELDFLLDKISQNGINSLSDSEMAILRKAREQMKKR